jgi:hypothetical protein
MTVGLELLKILNGRGRDKFELNGEKIVAELKDVVHNVQQSHQHVRFPTIDMLLNDACMACKGWVVAIRLDHAAAH